MARMKQDFVFIVKLQFGKTLVSVQNKFALKKVLVKKFLDQNHTLVPRKLLCSKNFESKNFQVLIKFYLEFLGRAVARALISGFFCLSLLASSEVGRVATSIQRV